MSAKSDKTTSYMQVTCLPMSHSESCYHCDYKTRCDAYALIMDLTAERNVCPLLPEMEKCVVDQIYLPHVLAPTKEGVSVNPEEVNKNRKLEQANRYVKVSGGENRYDKVSVEALRKASESISLPRTKTKCVTCIRWITEKCTETTLDVSRVYPNCYLKK